MNANTKHTPGPWEAVALNDEYQPFGILAERQPLGVSMNDIAAIWPRGGKRKTEANARLIAAAPDGLDAAEIVYLALLRHPHDAWRANNQIALCVLRDFIAKATGREAEDVQNEYEQIALSLVGVA